MGLVLIYFYSKQGTSMHMHTTHLQPYAHVVASLSVTRGEMSAANANNLTEIEPQFNLNCTADLIILTIKLYIYVDFF